MRVCPHRIGEEIEFNDSTDPNALWASTQWTQITDGRVTLASSSSHALGATGGAETHTLTVSEIPSHQHAQSGGWGAGSTNQARFRADGNSPANNWQPVGATGGGQAHNNMQPWRAVNRWRRVA